MAKPQVLVHDKRDNVGVVVVDAVHAGERLAAVVLEDDSDFELDAVEDVGLGHKLALKDLAEGDTVYKYGEDIGRMVAPAKRGGYVHVHNLKTKRW